MDLQGEFHDAMSFHAHTPESITLSRLYQCIFNHARIMRHDDTGIVAIALVGESGGIRSSGIIHSPILENAPVDGGSIMDPNHIQDWIEVSDTFQYTGDIIVAFGIGVDLQMASHDLIR